MTKGVKDWGHDIASALSVLTRAEGEVHQIAVQTTPRAFRQIGRWIIPEEHLPPKLGRWRPTSDLLRILRADKLRVWQLRLLAPKAQGLLLRSSADAILLKANLRAFYITAGITLKLPNPGRPASTIRLRQEIASRSQFQQRHEVRTPALVCVPKDGDFLAEELLRADPVSRSTLDPSDIARRYLAWQAENGLTIGPASTLLDLDGEISAFMTYCQDNRIAVSRQVKKLLGSSSTGSDVVCGICNGDLTITNLMYSPDTLYIVDWEWANSDLIFTDAVRLGTQLDGYTRAFVSEYNRLAIASEAGLMAPIQQYLVAAVHVAVQRLNRREDFVDDKDLSAYAKRLKVRIEEIAKLGNLLAANG